jgi:hypothetical protein
MQYLECLTAALSDMASTYQPAERMSTVLRAVMVELRGGPEPPNSTHFNLYKPASSTVPARRGSTIDMDADSSQQWAKKRQTSRGRPRAGTGGNSRKTRTMSMSTTMSMPSSDHGRHSGLSIKAPPPPRFDDPSGQNNDGYILVTPRSELGSTGWPSLSEPPELSHNLSTPSTTLSSHAANRNSGAWMGADYDPQDPINQLANAHFPELSAFDDLGTSGGGGGGANGGGIEGVNLDFMPLGDENDWSLPKEWSGGVDMDGLGAFDM